MNDILKSSKNTGKKIGNTDILTSKVSNRIFKILEGCPLSNDEKVLLLKKLENKIKPKINIKNREELVIYLQTEKGKEELENLGIFFLFNKVVDISLVYGFLDNRTKIYRKLAGKTFQTTLKLLGNKKKSITTKKEIKEILKDYFLKIGYKEEDIILEKNKPNNNVEYDPILDTKEEIVDYLQTKKGKEKLIKFGVIFDGDKVILKRISSASGYKSTIAGTRPISTFQKLGNKKERVYIKEEVKEILKEYFIEIGYEKEDIIM